MDRLQHGMWSDDDCHRCPLKAQQEFFTREDVIKYTPDWKGERFPDGRPKVPDSILDRMKNVTLEEAWATLQQGELQSPV